jgi:hypothetical protein
MSAIRRFADSNRTSPEVRKVLNCDIHLFDPLVGAGEHGRRNGEEAIAGVTDDRDTL